MKTQYKEGEYGQPPIDGGVQRIDLPFLFKRVSRPEMCLHFLDFIMTTPKKTRAKRTQRDYTLGFKLAVVEQVEKGDFTYKQAQEHFGIQGRSTVLVWLRKHGKLDWSQSIRIPKMIKSNETPAQKIKRLERQLEDEQMKNFVLNQMVDVMDKEHGAGLRKKYLSELSGAPKKIQVLFVICHSLLQ